MKTLLLILILIIFSLLETTVLPLNLILGLIIVLSCLGFIDKLMVLAFLAGIITDLLAGRILGTSSLYYLFVSFFIQLYKNRFQADRWQFVLVYTLLVVSFWNLIWGTFNLGNVLLTIVIAIILLQICKFLHLPGVHSATWKVS